MNRTKANIAKADNLYRRTVVHHLILIECTLFLSTMKVETSYRRPTKLPSIRIGTDSGTLMKLLAVKPQTQSAESVMRTSYQIFFPYLILQKGTYWGFGLFLHCVVVFLLFGFLFPNKQQALPL